MSMEKENSSCGAEELGTQSTPGNAPSEQQGRGSSSLPVFIKPGFPWLKLACVNAFQEKINKYSRKNKMIPNVTVIWTILPCKEPVRNGEPPRMQPVYKWRVLRQLWSEQSEKGEQDSFLHSQPKIVKRVCQWHKINIDAVFYRQGTQGKIQTSTFKFLLYLKHYE